MLQFFILSAVVVLASCQTNCPDGWQKYEGSCYKFVETPKNWVAASKHCVANSPFQYGHLVTIHSDMESEFITYIVLGGRKQRAWIGLNDRVDEGIFTWHAHNREPFLSGKANWKWGEPNNGGKRVGHEEDCVEINRGAGELGLWNDCKCRKPLPFICEVELFTMEKGGRGNKAGLPKADPRFPEPANQEA